MVARFFQKVSRVDTPACRLLDLSSGDEYTYFRLYTAVVESAPYMWPGVINMIPSN